MIALAPGLVSSVASIASAAAAPLARSLAGAPAAPSEAAAFGQLVDRLASDSIDALKAGEAAAIAGVQGKASVQQVVDQVMSAERTLQTVIALRDKAVGAYQEISRMAI